MPALDMGLSFEGIDLVLLTPYSGTYAGYDSRQLAHDYEQAFAAARKCAADFDWDAVVSNMVYVWTGLTIRLGANTWWQRPYDRVFGTRARYSPIRSIQCREIFRSRDQPGIEDWARDERR